MLHAIHQMLRLRKASHRLFFWMFVFGVASATLLLLLYKQVDRQNRYESIDTLLSQSLESQKIIVENWAQDRMDEVSYLAQLAETRTNNYEMMGERYQYHASYLSDIESFVFLDEEGYVIVDSGQEDPLIHSKVSLRDRDYFKSGKVGNKVVSDIVQSKANGAPVAIFSTPVQDMDGDFNGIVFGAVSLSEMDKLLQNTALGETGTVLLVNRDGIILSGLNDDQTALSTEIETDIIASALVDEQPREPYENAAGELVIGEYLSLFDDRFFLIHEMEVDEALQPHYQMGHMMFIVLLFGAVIGMLLLCLIIRDSMQSLVYVKDAIQHVEKGNYTYTIDEKMYEKSPSEIQSIMTGFENMTKKIAENKQELIRLSETDELTGMLNRRTFTASIKREWVSAYDKQQPLSIAFIDIDFFKQLNDEFGHMVGDEVLIRISEEIDRALIGTGGRLYRYGGEEFTVSFQILMKKSPLPTQSPSVKLLK